MAALKLVASAFLSVTSVHALAMNATCQPSGGQCIRGIPCCQGACDVTGSYCEGGSHSGSRPPSQCLQPGMHCSGGRVYCCPGSHCEREICTRDGGNHGGGGPPGPQNCSPEEDVCGLWGLSGKPCCNGLSCEQSSSPRIRVCKRADPYSCAGPGQMCQWDGVSVTRSCCDGARCDLRTSLGHACGIPRSCANDGDECRWFVSGYRRQCCGGQSCVLQGLRYKCAWRNLRSGANASLAAVDAEEENALKEGTSEVLP